MKKIIFVLLILSTLNSQAQTGTPQVSYVTSSIANMKLYFGSSNRIHVDATNSDYDICTVCTADEMNIFAGAGGRKWMKVSDTAKQEDLAVINVLKHGVVADGATNQAANIQALIGSNKTLYFPYQSSAYALTDSLLLNGYSNLKFIAEKGVVITTTKNKIFQINGNFSNLEIANFRFVSTKSSATDDTEGLIFIGNYGTSDTINNVNIHNNYFTNAATKCNAIKMVSEGTNSLCKNFFITQNEFVGIGKMGVEFQNHLDNSAGRFTDYWIIKNYFKNIGTVHSGVAIAAISVSGVAYNGNINYNDITDVNTDPSWAVSNYGIENAGTIGLSTIDNHMRSQSYGYTGILGSSTRSKDGWIISGNIIILTGGSDKTKVRGMELNNILRVSVTGNTIITDGYTALLDSCLSGKFSNNHCYSSDINAFLIRNGSANNDITLNTIDNTAYGSLANPIQFSGSLTINNNTSWNTMNAFGGLGNGTVTNSSSATNNTRFRTTEPLIIYSPTNFTNPFIVGTSGGKEMRFGDDGATIGSYTTSSGALTGLTMNTTNLYVPTRVGGGGFFPATRARTTAYTTTSSDYAVFANAAGGNFSVTLESSGNVAGQIHLIKNVGATGIVTVVGTIDGATNYLLATQWKYVVVQTDGTGVGWYIIGGN